MDPLTIAVAFTTILNVLAGYAIIFLAVWLVAELCRIV